MHRVQYSIASRCITLLHKQQYSKTRIQMASSNDKIHLLCWSRGKRHMKGSQELWDQYWREFITEKPDVVFLQEEYSGRNRLFYKRRNKYSSFFNTQSMVGIVVKNQTCEGIKDKDIECNEQPVTNCQLYKMALKILGKYKVIVASIHAQYTSSLEVRIKNVEKFLHHLDTVGRRLGYSAVVVGADFNVDAAATLTQEQRHGFTIPSYSPSVHRAFHAKEFMCVDFFAYKNYGSDNVRVQNVHSHMIIKSPLIKANELEEEYHVDLKVYGDQKGYQAIRKAEMNHDPLHGELVFGTPVTPPTDESCELIIFSSAKKEPRAISIMCKTKPQITHKRIKAKNIIRNYDITQIKQLWN